MLGFFRRGVANAHRGIREPKIDRLVDGSPRDPRESMALGELILRTSRLARTEARPWGDRVVPRPTKAFDWLATVCSDPREPMIENHDLRASSPPLSEARVRIDINVWVL